MIKILFVCHGNICRSTMAEFYMKEIVRRAGLSGEIEVVSAATTNDEAGNDTYYATKDVLTEKGIPFTPRRAVKMTKDDYNTYDYIIVFDEENIRGVERITGRKRNSLFRQYILRSVIRIVTRFVIRRRR